MVAEGGSCLLVGPDPRCSPWTMWTEEDLTEEHCSECGAIETDELHLLHPGGTAWLLGERRAVSGPAGVAPPDGGCGAGSIA